MSDSKQAPPPPAGDPLPAGESLPADATEAWQIEAQLPALRSAAQHDLAAALGERLLEIREAELGPTHETTLEVIEALAESYFQLSRLERAEALLLRVLEAREAAPPSDSSALGDVLSQLAKVCRAMGALDRAEELYHRALAVYQPTSEDAMIGMAAAAHGAASLLEQRGQLDEAEKMCRMVLRSRERMFGEQTLPVAESLNSLAVIHRKKGDLEEAERLYLRALAIHEAVKGHDHPGAVPKLLNLGILYTQKEAHEKAGEVLGRAAALLEARGGAPDALDAGVLDALGNHYEALGDLPRGIDAARRALAIYEELLGPSHSSVALSLNNLGIKLAEAEETLGEAEAVFRRALSIVGDSQAADTFGAIALNLAKLRVGAGDLDEGEALAQRAHTAARESGGADRDDAANALVLLSHIAEKRKDLNKAIELMGAAFSIRSKRPEIDQAIADMTRMGTLMLAVNAPDAASKMLQDALELAAGSRGKDHPSVAHLIFLAGKVAMAQDNPEQALFCFDHSLEIQQKAKGRTDPSLHDVLKAAAEANLALDKLDAAEAAYRQIGEIYAAHYPASSEYQGIAPVLLGDVALKRKAYAEAAELFEQALAIAEGVFGKDSLRLQVVLDKAGEAHLQNENLARAGELSRRLLAIYERHVAPDHPITLSAVVRLGTVYLKTGDPRAEEMVKRAVASAETRTRELNAKTAQIKADLARRKGQS